MLREEGGCARLSVAVDVHRRVCGRTVSGSSRQLAQIASKAVLRLPLYIPWPRRRVHPEVKPTIHPASKSCLLDAHQPLPGPHDLDDQHASLFSFVPWLFNKKFTNFFLTCQQKVYEGFLF